MKNKLFLGFLAGLIFGAFGFYIFTIDKEEQQPKESTLIEPQSTMKFEEYAHDWDFENWKDYKRELYKQGFMTKSTVNNDSIEPTEDVYLKGAILKHKDPNKLYLAPYPTKYAIVLEIYKGNIVSDEKIGEETYEDEIGGIYDIVQLRIKRKSVLNPIMVFETDKVKEFMDDMMGSPRPKPKKPEPKPKPGALGVRGHGFISTPSN